GGPVGETELDQRGADDAEVGVIDPAPDIGGGDCAHDPRDQENGTQDAAADERAVERERATESERKGDHRRGDGPDDSVPGDLPEYRAGQDGHVVVDAVEDLVAKLEVRRRLEER